MVFSASHRYSIVVWATRPPAGCSNRSSSFETSSHRCGQHFHHRRALSLPEAVLVHLRRGDERKPAAEEPARSALAELQVSRRRAQETVVPGKPENPMLPPNFSSVVFICDVLHIVKNRPVFPSNIISALKPGGKAVIIDFFLAENSRSGHLYGRHCRRKK